MRTDKQNTRTRRLQLAIIGFFVLVSLSLVIIYLVKPDIYTLALSGTPSANDRYPIATTLFFLAVLIFVLVLIFGVLRQWRWLFWLLLLAFGLSVLEIPATLLQLAGHLSIFAQPFPLWYSLYRMVIALLEVGLAIWMWVTYRRAGVWGLGEKATR
jgi:hypothetical protein